MTQNRQTLIALCVGMAIGIGIGWSAKPSHDTQPAALASTGEDQATAPHRQSFDGTLFPPSKNERPAPQQGTAKTTTDRPVTGFEALINGEPFDALRQRAETDPAFCQSLFDRLSEENDIDKQGMLIALLASLKNPQAKEATLDLLVQGSAEQQKQALDIMQGWAMNDEGAQQLIRQLALNEYDTTVLVKSLEVLSFDHVEEGQSARLAQRLIEMTSNNDPALRSESLAKMAQWDEMRSDIEPYLLNGLQDANDEVKLSALFAVAESGATTEPLRQSLLRLAHNADARFDVRSAALNTLTRDARTADERRQLKALQDELDAIYRRSEQATP